MVALTPRLQVFDLHGPRTIPISKVPFTLGRGSDSDLQLAGADISREHAHIVQRGQDYVLEDLHSKFGTYVDGQRVREHILAHGDRIELGRAGTHVVFLAAGESTEALGSSSPSGELVRIAGLLEALRAIGAERVLDEVLALVLDQAIEITAAERGVILLADASGRLETAAARGAGRRALTPCDLTIGRTIPEHVFATGSEEMVAYLPDLPDAQGMHERTISHGIVNVLCTPLRLVRFIERGAPSPPVANIGVLYLDGRQRGRSPSETARAALRALAREAAVAIDSARLYREALEKARVDDEPRIAAAIQQALLPPARVHAGFFEADGVSVPSRAVGGDFYDYMDLPDGRFGVTLADVAGNGPAAALLTAVLQGIVSALSTVDGDVAQMARRANAALIGRRLDARFATAVLASLGQDGVLTYCNAGHNPPFLIRAGGLERLTVGGPVLGVVSDATYDAATLCLEPGDAVVLFSDGLSEAMGPEGDEFGDDRIAAVCENHRHAAPGDLVQALLSSVHDFTRGVAQHDDMTVLVVRYAATSTHAGVRSCIVHAAGVRDLTPLLQNAQCKT